MTPDTPPCGGCAIARSRFASLGLVVLGLVLFLPSPASAQVGQRTVPTQLYHGGIGLLFDGEYKDAMDIFRSEWRGAIKNPLQGRWIDSICYHTMLGETCYQVGDLEQALDHFTAALQLYLTFPDWMRRVQVPATIRVSSMNAARGTPWGVSTRGAKLGHYPNEMLISQGRIDNNAAFKQGGVVQAATTMPIEVQEIVRCTVLSIRRRGEILGPLTRYDDLTGKLIAALSQRPGVANHWTQAWIDVELGVALHCGGKDSEAVSTLNRSLAAGGEFDHPLTGVALLELGKIAFQSGNQAEAARLFLEASYAAYHYGDLGVLEESLYYGAMVHLAANARGLYPPLAPAAAWAKTKQLRQLRVSLLLSAAENLAVLQQTPQAVAMLDDAQAAIGRRPMGLGRIGARLHYLRGLALFQQRKIAPGDEAVRAAMAYMQRGSLWLFQIGRADRLWLDGQLTPRSAMVLFNELLRDPQPADWATEPMEAMAVLTTPHPLPLEHWFLVALQRNDHETALEISDRARRHRYFSSLAYGGRLHSLRWILEAPDEALDQPSLLQRQDLAAQYPAFAKLSQHVRQLRGALKQMPLVAKDTDGLREQARVLGEIGAASLQQEAILREIAVRREPAGLVFPPLYATKDLQKMLPKGTAVLAFFAAGGDLYAFLLNQDKYGYWTVKATPMLTKKIVGLLREMGNFEQNHEVGLAELTNPQWKQSARQVLDGLVAGSSADFTRKFPELVIVPDGLLWYLPFECLQVNIDNQLQPLISRFRIRYVPTVSLAAPDRRGRNPAPDTAVVLGKLYPQDKPEVAQAAYEQLAKSLPRTSPLSKPPLPAPTSLYKIRMGGLIVLDDLAPAEGASAYSWLPVQVERGKAGNTLDDWLALPWGGPDTVVLPGFHTMAENSLKRANRAAPGAEVFLSVCGLMSTGARTLLISRWRTGGQSSYDLVREFAQELPHTTPSDAWQRAVLLAMESRLNLEGEPRIKKSAEKEELKGEHPFFWAGYLLVDRGNPPEKAEEPPPAAEKPQPKEKPGAEKPAAGKAKAPAKEEQAAEAEEKPAAQEPPNDAGAKKPRPSAKRAPRKEKEEPGS